WGLYGLARRALASPKLNGRYADSCERMTLAIALVWAVHPLATQSVTYLYQREESLMGMFYLLTLYGAARLADGGSVLWAAVSLIACLLGMGTKEVMVTAPL